MPRQLSATERNDVATAMFNDSFNLGGSFTMLGVARAGTSLTGIGSWYGGTYGALLVNANGSYSYRLDNDDPDTNVLGAGQQADERFTITYSLGGVTQTDTITIRITGVDEPGQQVTTGTASLQMQGDVTIGALQQINIASTHSVIWSIPAGEAQTFVNHGMIRGEAGTLNGATAFVAEAPDRPDTSATVINYGLIESHAGGDAYSANGPGGVGEVTFINHGVIRMVSDATNQMLSNAGRTGARHMINTGTIESISTGEAYGVSLGLDCVLDNSGYIYVRARQHHQSHSITGVAMTQSSGVLVNNSGTIHVVSESSSAQSFGIAMFRDNTNHYSYGKIVNSGTIVADVAAMGYQTIGGCVTAMMFVNSGRVEGEYRQDIGLNILDNRAGGAWVGTFNGGIDGEYFRNAGLLQGAINFREGTDFLDGRAGTQTGLVDGGAHSDVLLGGVGSDQLSGGDGADRLQGGGGIDILLGGAGADVFVYGAAGDSTAAALETLTDFQAGVDRIDLSLLAPSAVNLSMAGGFTTITATAASGTLTLRVNGTISLADIVSAPKAAVTDGTGGADLLFTGTAGATLNGLGGDDVLDGGDGNDLLDGGAGVDVMRGGKGDDVYYQDDFYDLALEMEDEGVDELRIATSARMQAFVENLTMLGTGSFFATGNGLDNIIIGNAGSNEIYGEDGDDILIGGGGRDFLTGGAGRDVFRYLAASDSRDGAVDVMYLDTGEDRIDLRAVTPLSVSWEETRYGYWQGYAIENLVTVQTAAGTMRILVANKIFRSDFILGTELLGSAASESVNGTGNADTILGGGGDDQLFGSGGDDTLSGEAGNDRLDGGAGNDVLTGGRGDDVYLVNDAGDYVWEAPAAGRDTVIASVDYILPPQSFVEVLRTPDEVAATPLRLVGNTQDNLIIGNAGDNVLDCGVNTDTTAFGYAGADTLRGLGGDDIYYVDGVDDIIVELAGEGSDTLYARGAYALAAGVSVETLVMALDTPGYPWTLTGNELGQRIIGNLGIDVLSGLAGDDMLSGGRGNDRLIGGLGSDRLEGGAGADVYVFETLADSRAPAWRSDGKKLLPDVIVDFEKANDRIDLAGVDAITGTPANDAFTFIGTGAFTGQAGQLRYATVDGATTLYADLDGDGGADMQIVLLTPVTFAASDFIL
ncbi:MAG TPA: M10 family metallopeptidase C-terminal domain-containing protein [Allosphingosinicella sp.]|nr:M10 family metallopeptidase C-terminal domain-containing protein [Allosphingosinicella sp.]